MTDQQFEALKQRLDALLLLLFRSVPEEKAGKDLLLALNDLGLAAKDIAPISGLTPNNVRVTLQRARKTAGKSSQDAAEE
jgi:DNA-directed RNA polymerase specialized sigma24 family protein